MKSVLTLSIGTSALLLSFFSFSDTSFSQSVPSGIGISISSSIQAPVPGQSVTITAESYTADLDSSNIIWTVNGQEYSRGIGQKSITLNAPSAGKEISIRVTAVTTEGTQMTNSMTLGSGDVDLVIEPLGYAHPFFKGKAPLSYQSEFKIIAMPQLVDKAGKTYDARSLVYEWKRDWKALPDESGYGKQVLNLTGDIVPRPYTISVKVSSRDGSAHAERYESVTPIQPSILFYKDDPLYGTLYNKAAMNRVSLGKEREMTILAVPFGFSTSKDFEGLQFDWSVNGSSKTELREGRTITMRAPEDASGTALIHLNIRSVKEMLQGASNSLFASFSAAPAAEAESDFTSF